MRKTDGDRRRVSRTGLLCEQAKQVRLDTKKMKCQFKTVKVYLKNERRKYSWRSLETKNRVGEMKGSHGFFTQSMLAGQTRARAPTLPRISKLRLGAPVLL